MFRYYQNVRPIFFKKTEKFKISIEEYFRKSSIYLYYVRMYCKNPTKDNNRANDKLS